MTTENKKIGPIQAYKIIWRNKDNIPQPDYYKWVFKTSSVLGSIMGILFVFMFKYYPDTEILYMLLFVGAIIWPISFFIGYKKNLNLIKVNNFE